MIKRINFSLLVILIIAAFLRFYGANPGYNQYHSDEPILYGTAIEMIRNHNLYPQGRYDYGGFTIYLNYIFFKVIFIPFGWVKFYLSQTPEILKGIVHLIPTKDEANYILSNFIFGNREVNALIAGRYLISFISLCNVFIVYFLGKKLFNKRTGLLAALFLAVNFRHVMNSHVNLPDIYNSLLLLLSTYGVFLIDKKPNLKNYIVYGFLLGMSVSVKYQVYALLPFVALHLIKPKLILNIKPIISGLITVLVFLVINPYFFIEYETAFAWLSLITKKYGMGTNSINLYPVWYLYNHDMGQPLFIMSITALFLGFLKSGKRFIIYIFPMVLYFAFMFLYYSKGGFYVRNIIMITPFLTISASFMLDKLIKNNILIFLFLPFLIYIPAKNSLISAYYQHQPWNYGLTAQWLRNNLPSESVVAAHPFDPPGGPSMNKVDFLSSSSYSIAEHKELGATHSLVNMDWAGDQFYYWMANGMQINNFKKPTELLRNSFYGIAIEELCNYQIFSATKPWQAPDAALVLAKLPQYEQEDVDYHEFAKFDFNIDEQGWEAHKLDYTSSMGEIWSDGSIVFDLKSTIFPANFVASKYMNIKPEYLYKINGKIYLNENLSVLKRDGFLRVEFINNKGDVIYRSVSARAYGSVGWNKITHLVYALQDAEKMRIGLQANSQGNYFKLDDVIIEESDESVDNQGFVQNTNIDLNLLYTNSHGNL